MPDLNRFDTHAPLYYAVAFLLDPANADQTVKLTHETSPSEPRKDPTPGVRFHQWCLHDTGPELSLPGASDRSRIWRWK